MQPEDRAMPLRDHFHPPVTRRASWEGFQGQWPAMLVQHLTQRLPSRYRAEPRVHSGAQVEIDVATFEQHHGGYQPRMEAMDRSGSPPARASPSRRTYSRPT